MDKGRYLQYLHGVASQRIPTYHDIDLEVSEGDNLLYAFINPENWKINIGVSPEYRQFLMSISSEFEEGTSYKKLEFDLLKNLLTHEYGHFSVCPYDYDNFKAILEAISEYVEPRTWSKTHRDMVCLNLHNLFADTIVDTRMSYKYKDYAMGSYYSRLCVHLFHRSKMSFFKKLMDRTPKYFVSFFQSVMILSGIKKEIYRKIGGHHPITYISQHRILKEIVDVFTRDAGKTQEILDGKRVPSLVFTLEDRGLWPEMAYEYAKIMFPLMKDTKKEVSKSSFSKKKGKKEGKKEEGPKEDDKSDSPMPDDKEQKKASSSDKDGDKDIFDKLDEKKDRESKEVKMIDFLYLDKRYRELARPLKVYASDEKEENDSFKYSLYTNRESVSIHEMSPRHVDWSSTRIGPGMVDIFQKSSLLDLDIDVENEPEKSHVPDMCFVIDSSISMGFDRDRLDGEYHYAVLAFYNILEYLTRMNLIYLMNFSSVNFSRKTIYSGWHPYRGLEKIKKTILAYQGDYTILDHSTLDIIYRERQNNFILFMLSDGGFSSESTTDRVSESLIRMSKSGSAGIFHFQIGDDSIFSIGLKRNNIPVYNIRDMSDFMRLSIQFTKELYGVPV